MAPSDSRIPLTSIAVLARDLATPRAPVVLDVRRDERYRADDTTLPTALRVAPESIAARAATFARNTPVVCFCVHGDEVSQSAAQSLAATGLRASYLEGGIEAWRAAGHATMRKHEVLAHAGGKPSRWVTRARPKIDRIACPWLVRRFVDPRAEFLYVPSERVRETATRVAAEPYDVPDVRFSHRGGDCSFDAFIAEFGLRDRALARVAQIVRGADTDRLDLAPQSSGLAALSLGLSALHADDSAMLEAAMPLYDALYAWARDAGDEVHNAALFAAQPT